MNRFSLLAFFVSLMLIVAACGGQPPAEPTEAPTEEVAETPTEEAAEEPEVGTIVEVAAEEGSFGTLISAVDAAGLVETLSGEGPFTVFAPTDEAFEAIDTDVLNALLEDQEALEQVLLYHVVEGEVLAEDVVGLEEAETAQGGTISIMVEDDTVTLNDSATVTATDIMASNGVIHVIDTVLLPPDVTLPVPGGEMEEETEEATEETEEATEETEEATEETGEGATEETEEGATEGDTIVDVATAAGNFSTLLAAADAAGLVDTLSGEGPFTVFAPTDEAFGAIDEATLNALLEDTATLEQILLYHVVEGEVLAADVVELSEATTVQGAPITITVDGETVLLNDSTTVTSTDIMASNGVIHVIDSVLLPPDVTLPMPEGEGEAMEGEMEEGTPTDGEAMEEGTPTDGNTIADLVGTDENFSTLLTAVEAAGLAETLSGEGPFTVFAPTNEAFEAIDEATLNALLEDTEALEQVLLYHVVEGEVPSDDVVNLDEVETVQGSTISVTPSTVDGGTVTLNESVEVTEVDIMASNGVIHAIDTVLLPPDVTLPEGEAMEGEMEEGEMMEEETTTP